MQGTPLVRVKITGDYQYFRAGETRYVDEKTAKFLIKNGYAIKSKDMTSKDYQKK
jgi:hypothetical protein